MPKGQTVGLTDREQLETKIQATVQWEFGHGLCDAVDAMPELSPEIKERLKKLARTAGNNIIRVSKAHLDHYAVVRRPEKEQVNLERVARRVRAEG